MRHRDKETVVDALEDWRGLRKKIAAEGGENYVKPVLVKFLDTGTFEVMDRDIVEDSFYVLRERKIMRDLAPDGRDLEAAIRDAGRDARPKDQPQRSQRKPGPEGRPGRQPRQGKSARQGQQSQRGPQGQPSQKGQPPQQGQASQKGPDEKRGPRRGRRRGRRTGKRGPRPPRDRAGPPPAA